jgi:hypothetical protein
VTVYLGFVELGLTKHCFVALRGKLQAKKYGHFA